MKESTSHSRVVLPLHEQGIAIYSRKSRFTGKGESVGNQIELCRQYLRAHEPDAPEPEIFEDDGFSGGDLNRPAFRRMMRAAEAGRFRMLIVYRLDRISRSIGDFTALIERLVHLNVAFVSIREQFDTSTPMGRAMMYIASVFSQLERETIAERIRDNLHELAKTGRWLGGITPTGFASEAVQTVTVDGRTKRACRLRLLPEEAETRQGHVQPVRTPRLSDSRCKGTAGSAVLPQKTATRSRHAVRDILHNPVYAQADADMLAWLRAAGTELSARRRSLTGGTASLPITARISPAAAPPSPCRRRLGLSRLGSTPGSSPAHSGPPCRSGSGGRTAARRAWRPTPALLAGLLQCRCGRPMYAKYRRAADGERFSYVCRSKSTGGREQCSCPNVPGTAADAAVRAMLCALPETMPCWRPHSGGCGATCLNPLPAPPDPCPLVLRDCLTPSAGRSAFWRPDGAAPLGRRNSACDAPPRWIAMRSHVLPRAAEERVRRFARIDRRDGNALSLMDGSARRRICSSSRPKEIYAGPRREHLPPARAARIICRATGWAQLQAADTAGDRRSAASAAATSAAESKNAPAEAEDALTKET